ncbi:hypothetical protein [Ekhidna sp.]|uniref:hypothetical protein n=1 Tax=Ekhidna sp. TaxID=2608089 RepID=UPI003CCB9F51
MKNAIILIILSIIASCGSPSKDQKDQSKSDEKAEAEKQSSEGYLIAISEIDNSVSVFVEDSLIFTSGTIHSSPKVDFQIDLTQFIENGNEKVRVELYNGVEPYNPQHDPKWEVRYDLIIDGEIVDFVHEFGDDNAIGKVWETTYDLSEW